jgi:hypothetical protein
MKMKIKDSGQEQFEEIELVQTNTEVTINEIEEERKETPPVNKVDVIGTRIKNELKLLTGVYDFSDIQTTKTLHVYLKNKYYNLTLELGPKS